VYLTMVSRRKQSRRTTDDNIAEVPEAVVDESQSIEQNEPPQHILPNVVRDRQRAVAEREASRLARPDGSKSMYRLSHADRKKSAVTSTPSGFVTLTASDNFDIENSANSTEEWCGPWSVARQMISKREDARRRREELGNDENNNSENHPLDNAMVEFSMEQQRKAHPSMQWKSSLQLGMKRIGSGNIESLYRKRQKRMNVLQNGKKVPSLFNLCVTFLADNVDFIESLGIDTDSDIRTAVMDRLIADQLLNDTAFDVLAEIGIDTLEISDGSNITEDCLAKRLEILLPAGLKNVRIDQCGRCFTSRAVQAMISAAKSAESGIQIKNLMIGGAYGLQDIDAAKLVEHLAPPTLGFKACNLLGKLTCQSLCDTYGKSSLLTELFLEDIPLALDDLNLMVSKQNSWKHLKRLSLRRINGLDDTFLHGLFGICCNSLDHLDLTDNFQLTDAILASLRFHNVAHRLVSLNLQGLKQLTPFGLEAFFTVTQDETDSASCHPIRLQQLNLGQCRHDAVTDEVIRLVVGAAPILNDSLINEAVNESDECVSYQTNKNYKSLSSGGLVSLNVQGSSCISDTAMEYLASKKGRTYQTLKELNISFCPSISDQGLGYLIDNCQIQLSKIEVWGNAQLTDNLYDGHLRVDDSRLEIVGVWMKKATSRTIR
jgi:hypothetical protein